MWYGRLCSGCGERVAAATQDPAARVLCPVCCPGDLPLSPDDEARCLTIADVKDAIQFLCEREGAWGQNLGTGKRVLLEVNKEKWEAKHVKAAVWCGRFVLIMEAGRLAPWH